jgi:hypothetical protein
LFKDKALVSKREWSVGAFPVTQGHSNVLPVVELVSEFINVLVKAVYFTYIYFTYLNCSSIAILILWNLCLEHNFSPVRQAIAVC